MLSDQKLADQIRATEVPADALAFWFIGQMGFIFKSSELTVYIDPFFSPHPKRSIPYFIHPEEVEADLILGTHDHKDHIDRAAWKIIADTNPETHFALPGLVKEAFPVEGVAADRLIGLEAGSTTPWEELRITGIPACHEFFDQEKKTRRYPYLGYVINWGNKSIYHAGDTCIYEGLETRLKEWTFDLVIVPINGRSAELYAGGRKGNMTYQEAVDLAGRLKPRLVVPGHWDLFDYNGEDPYLFSAYYETKYQRSNLIIPDYMRAYII